MDENGKKLNELTKYYSLFFYIALSVWSVLYILGIIFLGVDSIIGIILLILCFVFPVIILNISNFQIKNKLEYYNMSESDLTKLKLNKKKINLKLSDILVGGFTGIYDFTMIFLIFIVCVATNITEIFGISLECLVFVLIFLIILETAALVIYILMRNNIILNHILTTNSCEDIKEIKNKKKAKKEINIQKKKEVIKECKKNGDFLKFKKNKANFILYIFAIALGIVSIFFCYNLTEHWQRYVSMDSTIYTSDEGTSFTYSSFVLLFHKIELLNYISRIVTIVLICISLAGVVISFIFKKKVIGVVAIFVGYFSQFISMIDFYNTVILSTLGTDYTSYMKYYPEISLNIWGFISIFISAILFGVILIRYFILKHNMVVKNTK